LEVPVTLIVSVPATRSKRRYGPGGELTWTFELVIAAVAGDAGKSKPATSAPRRADLGVLNVIPLQRAGFFSIESARANRHDPA
jgi:hypothetical protein